jgi:predicted dehydrogenase
MPITPRHDDGDGPVRLLIVGAGSRGGDAYGGWCARHPDRASVIGVVEPHPLRRDTFADEHGIPHRDRYARWELATGLLDKVEAVVIATPDRLHVEPTVAALAAGRHVLLEKPMGATAGQIARIAAAEAASPAVVTVCHVLRYTPFFARLREILDEQRIGEVLAIQHTENIGFWHFAHSYVRGNWHREATSSPMLLAKACHDLDILRWLVGRPALRVSSFGSLTHFRPDNSPEGAPDRCIDGCPAAPACPYDAVRIYVDQFAGWDGWPISAVTRDPSVQGRRHALRTTDYGRCVYKMDNDVVDHQVVNVEFEGGATASLTVTGFTRDNTRTLKVMGTHGEIRGHLDRGELEIRRFVPAAGETALPVEVERVGTEPRPGWADDRDGRRAPHVGGAGLADAGAGNPGAGHAGGDDRLMDAFVSWLAATLHGGDAPSPVSSMSESLESHVMALAAERSRRDGICVDVTAETRTLLAGP